MTRLRTLGFETGDFSELDSYSTGGQTVTLVTDVKRTGNYSLYVSNVESHVQINFPGKRELYIGFAVRVANAASAESNTFTLRNSAGTTIFRIALTTAGAFAVYYSSTLLFTTSAQSLLDWHYFEWHVKTDATIGEVELKIDGVSAGSYIGNTGSESIDNFRMLNASFAQQRYHIDDIVINDIEGLYNNTFPGQIGLLPSPINADGSVTLLQRGGTDTGANWSQVNAVPADANYVYSEDVDEYDLYEISPISLVSPETAQIYNVHVVTQAMVEAGAGVVASALKTGSEMQEGDEQVVSGTYRAYAFTHPLAEGGSSWTQDKVNAIEIGPKTKGGA